MNDDPWADRPPSKRTARTISSMSSTTRFTMIGVSPFFACSKSSVSAVLQPATVRIESGAAPIP